MLAQLLSEYKISQHVTKNELYVIKQFEKLLAEKPDCFDRQPGGHITGSAWIIDSDNSAVLLTHHKKLNKWLQLGGHCDGEIDVRNTALREAQEESGMQDFDFLLSGIFDIDIHPIPNACAYHYDVRFLLQSKNKDFFISDESHALAWVPFDGIQYYCQEESIARMHKKYINFFLTGFL
jgi:8-oxo-dGTP pyrophosphatase MutT (NUDIX family)